MIEGNGKSYSFFPGCSAYATGEDYAKSTRAVVDVLGLDFTELDDWNCCGTTLTNSVNKKKALVLAARNLSIAAQSERDLVTGCSGCYLSLFKADKTLTEDDKLRGQIDRALQAGDMQYGGPVRVRHILEVISNDVGEEAIRSQVKRSLAGLKVACYYGCQITRPYAQFDDEEMPTMMDDMVTWLDGEPIDFPLKTRCCGGMMMMVQPDVGRELTAKVLRTAIHRHADCVITACPLCQINLEGNQDKLGEAIGTDCHIPIMSFTQLLGVAMGLSSEDLALEEGITPVEEMLAQKVGL